MIANPSEQFIIDSEGNKIAVVLSMETYQQILDRLDEFQCLRAYDQALSETSLGLCQLKKLLKYEQMSHEILIPKTVQKQLDKLSDRIRAAIIESLLTLQENPRAFNSIKMKGC
jgi:hypothetical protein